MLWVHAPDTPSLTPTSIEVFIWFSTCPEISVYQVLITVNQLEYSYYFNCLIIVCLNIIENHMQSKKKRIWAAEGFAYAMCLISKHFSDDLVLMYLLYIVYRAVHCKKSCLKSLLINSYGCLTAVEQPLNNLTMKNCLTVIFERCLT